MTNFQLLTKKIEESGMTMVSIARISGIERATLYNRLRGVGEFTATEIVGMTKALHLSMSEREAIFFCPAVVSDVTQEVSA